jgi:hypothetical protein
LTEHPDPRRFPLLRLPMHRHRLRLDRLQSAVVLAAAEIVVSSLLVVGIGMGERRCIVIRMIVGPRRHRRPRRRCSRLILILMLMRLRRWGGMRVRLGMDGRVNKGVVIRGMIGGL